MDAFFERLKHYAEIRPEARRGLEQADHTIRGIERHQRIISEGEAVRHIYVMESGWAVRKRELEDGRHQILNFLRPGDIFDLQALIDSRADHTIEAIEHCRVRQIGVAAFLEVIEREATAMSALWWSSVQEDGIMREHIIRVGRRSAIERIAHLCVELHRRLAVCGEAGDSGPVNLPVT